MYGGAAALSNIVIVIRVVKEEGESYHCVPIYATLG